MNLIESKYSNVELVGVWVAENALRLIVRGFVATSLRKLPFERE